MSLLQQSACLGMPPASLNSKIRVNRKHLVYKLMQERRRVRVVIAPSGFGKTMLAANYAHVVFNFQNSFWVSLDSIEVLQIIDAGLLTHEFINGEYNSGLVVFEDFNLNEGERLDVVLNTFDALLEYGYEILITTTPQYASFFNDVDKYFVLNSHDLLLMQEEYDTFSNTNKSCGAEDTCVSDAIAHKVCSYAWGDGKAQATHLKSFVADIPKPYLRFVFVVCALKQGLFAEVAHIVNIPSENELEWLQTFFPHTGINVIGESFDTFALSALQLKDMFNHCDSLVHIFASTQQRDEMIEYIADILMARNNYARAAEMVLTFCSRTRRLAWMRYRQRIFLNKGLPQVILDTYGTSACIQNAQILLGISCGYLMLGNTELSAVNARRVAYDATADSVSVAVAFFLASFSGDNFPESMRDIFAHMDMHEMFSSYKDRCNGNQKCMQRIDGLTCARDALLRAQEDIDGVISKLYEARESVSQSILGTIAVCNIAMRYLAFQYANIPANEQDVMRELSLLDEVLMLCEKRMHIHESSSLAAYVFKARHALREIAPLDDLNSDETLLEQYQTMLLRIKSQKHAAHKAQISILQEQNDSTQGNEQKMFLQLFGGLRVYRKKDPIDVQAFTKHKAQILLAILAIYKGKEVSRQRIIDIMWPKSNYDKALGNFYSIWSVLKKSLSDAQGRCPYLVKYQYGCMVDNAFVSSDVERFDEICQTFTFDNVDVVLWPRMLKELQDNFSSEFLPAESKIDFIVDMRKHYAMQLGDSLKKASDKLFELRHSEQSLLFAQEAWRHQSGNESCCRTLMRAHLLCEQPTEAIRIYLEQMEYLRDMFGVNPAQKTFDLYQEALVCSDGGLREENATPIKATSLLW